MEDPYEHEDPMMGYAPCNVPGRGCDPAAFDDCFAEGCACEDNCARWSGRNIKIYGGEKTILQIYALGFQLQSGE